MSANLENGPGGMNVDEMNDNLNSAFQVTRFNQQISSLEIQGMKKMALLIELKSGARAYEILKDLADFLEASQDPTKTRPVSIKEFLHPDYRN